MGEEMHQREDNSIEGRRENERLLLLLLFLL